MAFARYESEKFTCIDVGVWLLKLNGFLMGSRDILVFSYFAVIEQCFREFGAIRNLSLHQV